MTAANDRFTYAGIYCGAMFLISGVVSNGIPVYRWLRRWRSKSDVEKASVDSAGAPNAAVAFEGKSVDGPLGQPSEKPLESPTPAYAGGEKFGGAVKA